MSGVVHSQTVRAYCAGFMDGDGSVQIGERKQNGRLFYSMRVGLCNTNRDVLEFIQHFYGGSIYEYDRRYIKTLYYLQLTGRQAYQFCKDVRVFCIVKKNRVQNAIEFYEYQKSLGQPRGGSGEKRQHLTEEQIQKYKTHFTISRLLNRTRGKRL